MFYTMHNMWQISALAAVFILKKKYTVQREAPCLEIY